MTHVKDDYIQMLWSKSKLIEVIDEGNSSQDQSKVIPTDDSGDDDDHNRWNPTDEEKIRIGIIAGAVISACVVVTIVACICKKRRDSKNSRAFSDFFADDSG